jgi:hypothetical protein
MPVKSLLALLLVSTFTAQAETLSTSVSRTITLPPDESTLEISVAAGSGVSAEQILKALESAGVTAQDLTGISAGSTSFNPADPASAGVLVEMSLHVPFAATQQTIAKLEAARQPMRANKQELRYTLIGNVSEAALAKVRERLLPELLDDSRRKAEALAAASGRKLGTLLSLGDGTAGLGYTSAISGFFLVGRPQGNQVSLSLFAVYAVQD